MSSRKNFFFILLLATTNAHALESLSVHKHTHSTSVYASQNKLNLNEAIRKAISSSPELAEFKAKANSARGLAEQAKSWHNPEIELEAENFGGSGSFNNTESAEYTYTINQLIEIGGKVRSRTEAALENIYASEAQLIAKMQELARDVHIAYAEVLANEEALELTIQQEKLAKKVLQTVSSHVDAAKEPEMQKSKAKVAYFKIQLTKNKLVNMLDASKDRLALLLGENKLGYSLDHEHFFQLKAPRSIQYYRNKLNIAPEIVEKQHTINQHEYLLQLESAKRIPDPTVGVGFREFKDSSDHAYLLKLSIPIPIFNRNSGAIANASAELTAAEAKLDSARLSLNSLLNKHWQAWQYTYNQVLHLKNELLPSAEKSFKLARTGYERGNFSYSETLDAQRTLFDISQSYYELLKEYHLHKAWVEQLSSIPNIN